VLVPVNDGNEANNCCGNVVVVDEIASRNIITDEKECRCIPIMHDFMTNDDDDKHRPILISSAIYR
jgi:hypothetical protein